jgi:hypothetical protein
MQKTPHHPIAPSTGDSAIRRHQRSTTDGFGGGGDDKCGQWCFHTTKSTNGEIHANTFRSHRITNPTSRKTRSPAKRDGRSFKTFATFGNIHSSLHRKQRSSGEAFKTGSNRSRRNAAAITRLLVSGQCHGACSIKQSREPVPAGPRGGSNISGATGAQDAVIDPIYARVACTPSHVNASISSKLNVVISSSFQRFGRWAIAHVGKLSYQIGAHFFTSDSATRCAFDLSAAFFRNYFPAVVFATRPVRNCRLRYAQQLCKSKAATPWLL